MRKLITIIAIFSFVFASGQSDPKFYEMLKTLYKNTVPQIKVTELNDLINNKADIVILDSREPKEYEVSHIANSIFVGYNKLELSKISTIKKDAKIIVYCSVGYRSERIGEKLLNAGYTNVLNLYGGIFEWVNNGFPVVDMKNNQTQNIHAYDKEWGKWLIKGVKKYD